MFEDRDFEIDELWYVFKGYFDEKSGGKSQFHESKKKFEKELEEFLGVKVRLIPSHRLFCDIAEEISEDMMKRRKRYGSPIKEVFRHLAAAHNHDPKFLEELEESFENSKSYLGD